MNWKGMKLVYYFSLVDKHNPTALTTRPMNWKDTELVPNYSIVDQQNPTELKGYEVACIELRVRSQAQAHCTDDSSMKRKGRELAHNCLLVAKHTPTTLTTRR